jgi:hypothetical protein
MVNGYLSFVIGNKGQMTKTKLVQLTHDGYIFFPADSCLAKSSSSTDSALLALANHARVYQHNAVATGVGTYVKSQH